MTSKASTQIGLFSKADTVAAAKAQVKTRSRMAFIDNLRVVLTVLVVLHHLSITYGASGSWAYQEPTTETASIILTLFTALNQGFFMGLFFLLSGYFVPGTVDRKGGWRFLKDRLVRLGIPLVVYSLAISPLVLFIKGSTQGWWAGTLGEFYLNYWRNTSFVPGPLWFVEALLIFSIVYLAGRTALGWLKRNSTKARAGVEQKPLRHWQILAFVATLAISSFAVRLFSPVGEEWNNFQLAFFPQYILMFAAGILAHRQGWLPELSSSVRRVWSIMTGMAIVLLLAAFAIASSAGSTDAFGGGLSVEAMILAIWEAVYCPAMSILLLGLFAARFNQQNLLGKAMAANAYAAYVIHAPLIVLLAYSLHGMALDPLLKFALVAPLAVAVCFAASALVRRIPGAEKVL